MKTRTATVENEVDRKRRIRDHEDVLSGLLEQLMPVFSHSPDGVYLYLDENHKVCNKRMADMFGLPLRNGGRSRIFWKASWRRRTGRYSLRTTESTWRR